MRLGAVLPVNARNVATAARSAEQAGFDSVWVVEAHNRGISIVDPFVALALAAASTERIELGSAVVQVPLRPAYLLAEQVASVAAAAPGRFILGVGAGSSPQDFEACGVDFERRFSMLDDHVRTVRAWLAGQEVDGIKLGAGESAIDVPVLVGAWRGSRWVQRAAVEFDGWIASAHATDTEEMVAGLARFRAANGTHRRAVAANLDGDRPDAVEVIAALASAGFDDVTVRLNLNEPRLSDRLERLRLA